MGTSIDITKEKQVEKAKEEFISNVNHDLRTHVSMVVCMVSFLLRHF
jgi:signal transduction histidine kinase